MVIGYLLEITINQNKLYHRIENSKQYDPQIGVSMVSVGCW